mmetsp:Transcript_7225/g.10752  ORF Transcript_7225/g.10752 Transcript_7225/m.10752 type:complete len:84 (+) Transcript_7225:83-334(+)
MNLLLNLGVPLWVCITGLISLICAVFYIWHLYHLRMERNMRDQVKSILFEYVPADDYNYVEMEMEDISTGSASLSRSLLQNRV